MARVTGKYDVGFERGDGGFSSVFGTYIGTRLKENKEKYARELKAADPKNAYSILSDLMKERRQLVQQMGRAQRETMKSGGGTYKRETGGRPDTSFREGMYLENMKFQAEAQAGVRLGNDNDATINQAISLMQKEPGEGVSKRILHIFNTIKGKKSLSRWEALGLAHAISVRFVNSAKSGVLSEKQVREGMVAIKSRLNYIPNETIEIDPSTGLVGALNLTDQQELAARKVEAMSGGPKTTVTGKLGGMDPSEVSATYKPYLDNLDAQIKKAKEDYEIAKVEYKGMIKGPDYNLALAPLSSRPSALSQSLSKYGRLREVDPSYAREAMTASEEAGKFVLPTPYEDLVSIEGAGGKSPINLMVDTAETLRAMRGLGTIEGLDERDELLEYGGGKFPDLTPEDVEFADSSVSRMLASLNSPLYKGVEYDGVREILEMHKDLFKDAEGFPASKIFVANSLADQMSSWEGSLSQDRIIDMSKKDKAEIRVADSIRESQAAYDNFLQTRDAEQYRAEISKTYNNLLNTPKEQRGLVGDAYLNEIERYESVDPSRRLPEELNFKLQGLLLAADEIATRGVLKPGYEGELPEAVPATKPEEHKGEVYGDTTEMEVEERYGE
tara:strand:+ start:50 stop:1891 length:1842 start_codon:yes stop_codon:yes gene_type:complete